MKQLLKHKKEIFPIALIILMVVVGIYFLPFMPAQMPTHWNAEGQVDDYASKAFALFSIPIIVLITYIVLSAIPFMSVNHKNITEYKYLYWIKIAMIIFMFILYIATIVWALGYKFDMGMLMIVLIAVLFYFIGYAIKSVKQNYFIGIRTPWTLGSEKVWDETHRVGSFLFRLVALMMLAGLLFSSKYMIYFVFVPIVSLVIFLFIYSFYLYKKEKEGKRKKEGKRRK